ncbi:hypothetical protein AAF712_003612 [Marasmius tenuissimus]|uniref:Tyrosinase copper-binding domain-containing protein n=1 Tax=Marasmius tenuissimus TaxID=585030 RepID=A0ABR3A6N7_9AGAR
MHLSAGLSGVATLFITLLQLSSAVHAQDATSCPDPSVRREWRELSDTDKQSYHKAVKCALNKPQTRYPNEQAVVNRLDDLTWTHVQTANVIHNVANFLPWHRMMVHEHEKLLRNECGYTGPYPYWDWTIDADANSVTTSPVWDPATGFGGNGATTDKCVKDGPYSDITLHIGTKNAFVNKNEPHCLTRGWNDGDPTGSPGDMRRRSYDSEMMKNIYSQPDYNNMHFTLENGPHNSIHNRVGGEMGPHWAPNDPIFYMHHANVDRVWAKWQGDNATRLEDYSGFNDVRQTQRCIQKRRYAHAQPP